MKKMFALIALLAGAAALRAAEKPAPDVPVIATSRPNILFILADDMGYADAGFNGCKEILTPNLDKLAKSGAILESFYVQPVCSPTRASLMTGRYVAHTGVYTIVTPNAKWGLPLQEYTLANALKDAGYETAITGKWHLGEYRSEYRPMSRGFEHQYGLWFGAGDYFKHTRDGQMDWHRDDKPCKEEGYSTHLLANEACRLIHEKQAGKPLFLYLPFQAVHSPLQVPDSYLAPYPNLQGKRKTYAGMVAAMDEAIGKVVAALDEAGLRENTLIVFSSDNGGPWPGKVTDNTPLRAGKGTIFEGGVRACSFATWPGHIPSNCTIKEPCHMVDWYPTILKLAGVTANSKLPLDGLDIWPVLTQSAKSPHDALLLSGTKLGQAAIRMGDWKLLLNAGEAMDEKDNDEDQPLDNKRAKKGNAGDTALLFNLHDDIGEKKNLAIEQPAKLKELREKLDALLRDAVKPGNK